MTRLCDMNQSFALAAKGQSSPKSLDIKIVDYLPADKSKWEPVDHEISGMTVRINNAHKFNAFVGQRVGSEDQHIRSAVRMLALLTKRHDIDGQKVENIVAQTRQDVAGDKGSLSDVLASAVLQNIIVPCFRHSKFIPAEFK